MDAKTWRRQLVVCWLCCGKDEGLSPKSRHQLHVGLCKKAGPNESCAGEWMTERRMRLSPIALEQEEQRESWTPWEPQCWAAWGTRRGSRPWNGHWTFSWGGRGWWQWGDPAFQGHLRAKENWGGGGGTVARNQGHARTLQKHQDETSRKVSWEFYFLQINVHMYMLDTDSINMCQEVSKGNSGHI